MGPWQRKPVKIAGSASGLRCGCRRSLGYDGGGLEPDGDYDSAWSSRDLDLAGQSGVGRALHRLCVAAGAAWTRRSWLKALLRRLRAPVAYEEWAPTGRARRCVMWR